MIAFFMYNCKQIQRISRGTNHPRLTFLSLPTSSHHPVNISVHPQSHELREAENVTLDCSTSGSISHWLFNNALLTTGGSVSMSGSSLVFSAFQFSQAGEYRCVAASLRGNEALVSFPATLSYFGEQEPHFTDMSNVVSVSMLVLQFNEQAQLYCVCVT